MFIYIMPFCMLNNLLHPSNLLMIDGPKPSHEEHNYCLAFFVLHPHFNVFMCMNRMPLLDHYNNFITLGLFQEPWPVKVKEYTSVKIL